MITKDHSVSAQWEHTVLVTETGHEVLTSCPERSAVSAHHTPEDPGRHRYRFPIRRRAQHILRPRRTAAGPLATGRDRSIRRGGFARDLAAAANPLAMFRLLLKQTDARFKELFQQGVPAYELVPARAGFDG